MPALINWDLLKQPYNWLIVGLICLFWLALLAIVWPQEPAAS